MVVSTPSPMDLSITPDKNNTENTMLVKKENFIKDPLMLFFINLTCHSRNGGKKDAIRCCNNVQCKICSEGCNSISMMQKEQISRLTTPKIRKLRSKLARTSITMKIRLIETRRAQRTIRSWYINILYTRNGTIVSKILYSVLLLSISFSRPFN